MRDATARQYKGDRLNSTYIGFSMLTDLAVIALALLTASFLRFGPGFLRVAGSLTGTWAFYSIATLLLSDMESVYYARTTILRSMLTFRLIRISLIVTTLYVITIFLTRFPSPYFVHSRLVILYTLLAWIGYAILFRVLLLPRLITLLWRLGLLGFGKVRILVCGDRDVLSQVRSVVHSSSLYRRVLDLVECECTAQPPREDVEARLDCYRAKLAEHSCDDLMIIDDSLDFDSLARFVIRSREQGIYLSVFSRLFENLGYFDPWLSFPERPAVVFFTPAVTRTTELFWRFIDIVVSAVLTVALLPLFGVLAAAIRLSSPGPVFFRQKRIGRNEQPFVFLKFRSMRDDLAGNVREHREYFARYVEGKAADGDGGSVYKATSPRITAIGRLMRKTSIDELPQLLNVLKGDMSLVGPRPCISYELQYYRDWQRYRFTVKPGLTGIWQVYGRSRLPFDAAQFLDLSYALKRSFGLNVRLLLKTVPVILFGRGGA